MIFSCFSFEYRKNKGFTLLEIILVLAIIGVMAGVILPAMRRSMKSEMMDGIDTISSQVKLVYNSTMFTGKVHRMVFDVKNSMFWAEVAPSDFVGRAPVVTDKTEERRKRIEQLLVHLNDDAKRFEEESKQNPDDKSMLHPMLEIPVVKREVLEKKLWRQSKNSLIASKELPGNVVFVKITTDLADKPAKYPPGYVPKPNEELKPEEKDLSYLYFFSNAPTTHISIQLAFRDNLGRIDSNALKFTLNLNTLTGKFKLLQGFEEPDFVTAQ